MPSETRSVTVPGGRLHVVVDGDGPPVLLVHAGIVDLRAWDPIVPYLVGAGFRVVGYDTRGFGRSATDDVEYSNRADLRAVLDDRIMGRPIPLDPPANDRLAEIGVPLLAVVGALDTSDTLAAAVRLEETVPGTQRVVLPGVAHMVGMEAPERLAGLIVDLVAPLGTWA
jgi:pimeloyl-ACP methyl ester carboxylesterase